MTVLESNHNELTPRQKVIFSRIIACLLLVVSLTACGSARGSGDQETAMYARSTSTSASPEFATIDTYIEQEMAALHLPGLALGIVKGDQIVHLKGFGIANSSGQPIAAQTPFVLESISKSFTALAVMQLVEAGKIDLDAPVQRYLPWFSVADATASAHMTLRHLLHQTSGISELTGTVFETHHDVGDDALETAVRPLRTVGTKPLGKAYEYSNMNYTILGLIVQTVAGQSFESYIQQHILDPLAMRHSYAALADARRNGLATGHRFWLGQRRPVATTAPYNRAAAPEGLISGTLALVWSILRAILAVIVLRSSVDQRTSSKSLAMVR